MANIFNNTTVSINSKAFTRLQSLRVSRRAANVAVHGAADTAALYEAGIPEDEVQVEVIGPQTVGDNEEGALVIQWNDGTQDSWTRARVFDVQVSGQLNGAIQRTYTIRKVPTP